MMRPQCFAVALVAMSLSSAVYSAESCTAGQRRLNDGEPCIPEMLFNYLYCLSKSGGGRVEVTKKDDSSAANGLEISVGGKGSGVIVKGEGNVGFKQTDANRVVKEISERIDPSLASKCESLSRPPSTSVVSSARTAKSNAPAPNSTRTTTVSNNSTICRFNAGPRSGQIQDYAPVAAIPIGAACQDGFGSTGVVIAPSAAAGVSTGASRELSSICKFLTGARAGTTVDYAPVPPIPVGTSCQDGAGSTGTVVSRK